MQITDWAENNEKIIFHVIIIMIITITTPSRAVWLDDLCFRTDIRIAENISL